MLAGSMTSDAYSRAYSGEVRSTGLYTDHYELTMLNAALRDGTAQRHCVFEVFARSLPPGRRYGVVAGIGRLAQALSQFHFGEQALRFLRDTHVVDAHTLQWLENYRFTGDIDSYAEGDLYFPGSPIITVTGTFGEAVILETLVLSVLNHDCAIASAASRMAVAAAGRPLIEMGSRRTHEESALACARAAYLAGFGSTSNLAAGQRYGVPTGGTAAHAFTLLHNDEPAAFRSQISTLGPTTTLLVDTYDITEGIRRAIEIAGTSLGAIRIDSGDLGVIAEQARAQLDSLGAVNTKIVLSGDLDEYSIAALAAAPVDAYGVGTALVTGSGAPAAGMIYKLVEVDGRPVVKRSVHKTSRGGRKYAVRRHKATGTATEEIVAAQRQPAPEPHDRKLQTPLVRGGEFVELPTLEASRALLREQLRAIPWEGLKLSPGEPALPTIVEGAAR